MTWLPIKYYVIKHLEKDGYQRGLDSMVYKFFDKKLSSSSVKIKIMSN